MFFRDIEIKGDHTLWDLYKEIKNIFCLSNNELASFFHVDEEWRQLQEIFLEDMTRRHFRSDHG